MNFHKIKLFFIILVIVPVCLNAQDKIYFKSGSTLCNITDITAVSVTYLPLESSKPITKYVNTILLIFNDNGEYLVPAKMDFSLAKTRELVKKFLQDKISSRSSDQLFRNDNTVVETEISKEDKNYVYMGNESKIEKKQLVTIIYKDGKHQILGSVSKAADILWAIHEQDNVPKPVKSKTETEKKDSGSKTTSTVTISPVKIQPPVENTLAESGVIKKTNNKDSTLVEKKEPIKNLPAVLDKESIAKKADEKIQQFTRYVKIILDKSADDDKVNKSINLCVLLFVDENKIVEVSSKNLAQDPKPWKIRDYLNHIKVVRYDRVEVKWRNISYITDIRKGADGNYYGNITFEQEFKGYKDGIEVYSDVTVKKADIILKTYEKISDGKTETLWDVLLGNIGVESTRPL